MIKTLVPSKMSPWRSVTSQQIFVCGWLNFPMIDAVIKLLCWLKSCSHTEMKTLHPLSQSFYIVWGRSGLYLVSTRPWDTPTGHSYGHHPVKLISYYKFCGVPTSWQSHEDLSADKRVRVIQLLPGNREVSLQAAQVAFRSPKLWPIFRKSIDDHDGGKTPLSTDDTWPI